MLKAYWCPYTLHFKFEARTSRQSMHTKDTWLLRIVDEDTGREGVGECALFRGLSAEDTPDYENILSDACRGFVPGELPALSSIRFGFETALANLYGHTDTAFVRGEDSIPINGLIWMGDKATMKQRIDEKLANGFKVLKLKIGGINFDDEVDLLRYIRRLYPADALELRLDANGSFSPDDALQKLDILGRLGIHSIEQPVRAGMLTDMARICAESPIPIALDEELIGIHTREEARMILETVRPHYIILKPALCGGLSGADSWVEEAARLGIGHWFTSALESNIGLEAIARHIAEKGCSMPQGLGTGQLFHNNFDGPLFLRGERMYFDPSKKLSLPLLPWRQ